MDFNSVSKKENEVLSMFFDENFVPHDYLDALFTSSLRTTATPQLRNSSTEFSSLASLKSLQNKCSSLLTHLDYYTNELTREFEKNLNDLQNSNSIISYSSSSTSTTNLKHRRNSSSIQRPRTQSIAGGSDDDNRIVGIMRLEYYIENLSSSINSLNRDLTDVNKKIKSLATNEENNPTNDEAIQDLQKLLKVKSRIQQVLETCQTIKLLVASGIRDESPVPVVDPSLGLAPTSGTSASTENHINNTDIELTFTLYDFQTALGILEEIIMEQVSAERKKVKLEQDKGKTVEMNQSYLNTLQKMIDLLPVFKNLSSFYTTYNHFVVFLENEKKRYLNIYKN